jgi:hypothetical protein
MSKTFLRANDARSLGVSLERKAPMDFGGGENLPTVKRTPMTLANPNKPEPNKETYSFRITSGLPWITQD